MRSVEEGTPVHLTQLGLVGFKVLGCSTVEVKDL